VSIDEARARAGKAIRELGHAFAGFDLTEPQIDRITRVLDDLAEELGTGTPRDLDDGSFGDRQLATYPQGRITHTFDDRPISGRASPWGLDMDLHRHGDEIEARLVLRSAHEGAPDRSHGGIVAALFDDVFGFVLGVVEQAAFTGRLTITYRAPTPLHRELSCRVRATGHHGRKLTMTGELVDIASDTLVAEAEALFITVDPDEFRRQTARRPAPPAEA